MTGPVRVALIGPGRWAGRLAEAIGRTPEIELAVCWGRDPAKTQAFAEAHRCRAAASLESALSEPGVEAALVMTPAHLHREHTLAAAERGLHVFVEKPMALHLADALEMERACRRAGRVLFVGHEMRRFGALRAAKGLLASGRLGRVIAATATFNLRGYFAPGDWRSSRETNRGGALMQLGVHHMDTLMYLLGPVSHVVGELASVEAPDGVEDLGMAVLAFESGARAAVCATLASPRAYHLHLHGTEANLDLLVDMRVWPRAEEVDRNTQLWLSDDERRERVPFEVVDALAEELGEFARCVRGQARPETGAQEGLAALAAVEAALRSSAERRPVRPRELMES